MAGLRKGHCYTTVERAYVRHSKFKKKSYIRGIPVSKVVRYDMGNLTKSFEKELMLVARESVQVRHNAIESARLLINKHLTDRIGNNFRFKIRTFPHHVLRENRMIEGAGADRMQKGMQLAFGKAIGVAAQLRKGQPFISLFVDNKNVDFAKSVLISGRKKLPGKFYVV